MKTAGEEKNRILVTGASGLIGQSIVAELAAAGRYEIVALGGRARGPSGGEGPRVQIMRGVDIKDYATLEALENERRIDAVIHCAGLAHQFGKTPKSEFYAVNARGTENVCRLAQRLGAARLIHLSSVSVYGSYGKRAVDETFECRPMGAYAKSKFEAERKALEACRKNKTKLFILRLATVIGEEDKGNISRLITTIDRQRFIWPGRGVNKKTLIYKNDVARAVGVLLEGERFDDPEPKTVGGGGKKAAEIYNLTGEAVEMKAVVETIAAALGRKIPDYRIPESLIGYFVKLNRKFRPSARLEAAAGTLEKWLSDDIYTGKKFEAAYDFEPSTPVLEALERQVRHYLSRKKTSE